MSWTLLCVFWFGIMWVIWQNAWLLNLNCAPHPRPSPLPTNRPDEMMMYHDESFQFSSLPWLSLSLSLSLCAKIKPLSTGSSQFSPLCYVSAKSKSRFKVQHVVKRPTWRRGRHLMRPKALQSQNPQVWCSFAKCKDKMDLWVIDSRLLVTENSLGAEVH